MSNSETSSTNSSLTRSLTKVKSKISSKLKISNSFNNQDDSNSNNDEPVLKAMKYDDIMDDISNNGIKNSNSNCSRSNSLVDVLNTDDNGKLIPRSSSFSLKLINPTTTSTEQGNLQSSMLSSSSSSSSSPVESLNEESSRNILPMEITEPSNSRKSIKTQNINNLNDAITHEEILLPVPTDPQSNLRNGASRLLTPNSELRSPFSTIFENKPFTVMSPPLSPKRSDSLVFDPLKKPDLVKNYQVNEQQFEPQSNDLADAVALSILDKVDDAKSAEWKI